LSTGHSISVVHSWSISVDLQIHSGTASESFRHITLARRGISEPWERRASIEIAVLALEAKGGGRRGQAMDRVAREPVRDSTTTC